MVGILFAAIAFGDQLRNNAVSSAASGIGGNLKVTLGPDGLGRVNVGYWVEELGGDGCSVSETEPGSVVINLASGVTATPETFSLSNCVARRGTGRQNVEFCVSGPGTYSLPDALVSGGNGQTLTSQTTAFKITAEGPSVEGASCADGGTDPDEVNTPPVVSLGADDVSEDEGTAMEMNGSFSDADGDTLTLTAVDENDEEIAGFTDEGRGEWSWSDKKFDDYSGKVFVTADDGNGGSTVDSFDWESTNVAPTIDNEAVSGSACRPTVTFDIGDPGTEDTWAHAVDFGGMPEANLLATIPAWVTGAIPDPYLAGQIFRKATKSAVYSSTGTKTITIGAKDDNAGEGSTQIVDHVVPNSVAEARFGPPVQIDGNGKGLFKAGSTIPVKVRAGACLFEPNGSYTPVSGANLKVRALEYISADTTGSDVTSSNVKANADGWMRASDNQYIYNLATPKSARGTYRLTVEGFTDRTSGIPTGLVAEKLIVIR